MYTFFLMAGSMLGFICCDNGRTAVTGEIELQLTIPGGKDILRLLAMSSLI